MFSSESGSLLRKLILADPSVKNTSSDVPLVKMRQLLRVNRHVTLRPCTVGNVWPNANGFSPVG